MSVGLVVLLALAAAIFSAIGVVIRQRATLEVPHDQGVSTTMVAILLRKKLWWAGAAVAVAGYAFQAMALIWGSLILVAPLLVSSLLFALPLSARLAHRRVSATDWGWAVLLTAALTAFVLVARVTPGDYRTSATTWALVTVIAAALVVGPTVAAARSQGRRRALLLAVSVSVLFAGVAVLTKHSGHLAAENGLSAMLASPAPYLVVILAVAATLLQQSAFHAGTLQTSVPAMLTLEPLIAVTLGMVVLGEQIEGTLLAIAVLPVAVAAMTAATIALGRDEGAYEDELEAELARRNEPSRQD